MKHAAPSFLHCAGAVLCLCALATGARAVAAPKSAASADLVVTNAKIYTADATHPSADSLAVSGGRLVFVGSAAGAQRFIGKSTRVENLAGRRVLPGLFDSHMHPISMIKVDSCDLGNRPMSLRDLSEFVRACVARYPVAPGGWLSIHQWNPSDGNQPDAELPTLAAALDRGSTSVAVQLIGSDGHHGAFNHVAMQRARNAQGIAVGFSKASLSSDFAEHQKSIGVDADGNPNGAVNESAKALMGAPSILMANFDQAIKARAQLPRLLNAAGITGILDAKVSPPIQMLYDLLEKDQLLTFRANLAQFYDPDQYKRADGHTDFAQLLAIAQTTRAKYAHDSKLRADTIKLFADSSMEGNPYSTPPTLPNTLAFHPYLQPRFGTDDHGHLTVIGYVDTDSATCREVRAHPQAYAESDAVRRFTATNGYHPGQCALSSGQLRHPREVIMEFVERFHRAGFTLHIHVIGDGSLSVALDALEAARASDGISTQRDGIAHVQLAAPQDVARIGRDHLFVAFTYSWATADPAYDLTVVPFIDLVSGNSYAALHAPGSYYESNVYPFKAVKQAGGILAAGSDAPVITSDPRPFVNMATAVTRALPGEPAQNPAQALSITDVIDAYTINGARFLSRDGEAGSLEAGKSADFIVLDRDIVALAQTGHAADIAQTRVLQTWFEGKSVYSASASGTR